MAFSLCIIVEWERQNNYITHENEQKIIVFAT